MKLREKYSRSFRRRSDRILGMLMLPGKEHLVGLVEIQVIEKTKALIERRVRNRHIGGKRRNQKACQAYRAE